VPKSLLAPSAACRRLFLEHDPRVATTGPAECFGQNADASPRHPLRLAYDTPVVPFREARL